MIPFLERRKKHARPRWLAWLLGEELPPRVPRHGWMFPAMVLLMLAVACESPPDKIVIKMPRESPQSVKMNPMVPTFSKKGETLKLRASAFDKRGRYSGPGNVRWSVEDPSVATVSQDGLLTILGSGETNVKVANQGEHKLESRLAIKVSIPSEVKIVPPAEDENPGKIHLGQEKKFTAEVLDDKGNKIEGTKIFWESTTFAATIGANGLVEGRAIGDTQIIAEEPKSGLDARYDLEVLDWKKDKKKRRRRRRR